MPSRQQRLDREIKGLEPYKEKRHGGDRHKGPRKPRKNPSKYLSKWERRKIVAWDGEGANLDDGRHVYNLLANSDGVRIINHGGLGTEEILNFFIKYGDPRAINVIFGGSYDVNMLLVDIPKETLEILWVEGNCFWKNWRIYYTNRKKLTVQKFIRSSSGHVYNKVSFTLWDVLGYFQRSFVSACRLWLGDLPILDEIEAMKLQRSVFSVEGIQDIIDYNDKECQLLVQLMVTLFDALDVADIQLVRYDGAGSIAAAMFAKNDVVLHKGKPSDQALLDAQYAYSGGRIEAMKIGNAENLEVYRYDINSAYPAQMVGLPSYAGATWWPSEEWDGDNNALVKVRWHFDNPRPFYPLWYREHDGTILYPRWGYGIYWGSEVHNLVNYAEESDYEILGCLNVSLANQGKPFDFVREAYATRLAFKKAGLMANEALKLGINSLYGKTAQQAGFRKGRIPTYHHLLWAGQTTSGTRAALYRAAMQKPEAVIAFATDAILSTEPLDLPISDKLGEWTHDKFYGITIVQPGVYWLKNEEGYWSEKYRGFDKGSLMRDGIVECWQQGRDYKATLTRFVGLGSALMRNDFDSVWRTWSTDDRTLTLAPSGKRTKGRYTCYAERLCDTMATDNMSEDVMSMPYPLLWDDYKTDIQPKLDGVRVDILEQEYLDSYA